MKLLIPLMRSLTWMWIYRRKVLLAHRPVIMIFSGYTFPDRFPWKTLNEWRLEFSHKEVGTHSIWSGLAMDLYLAKAYPEKIMIMGRWASSFFLRYIHIQVSDLSKGISTLMTTNHDFYTIP